MIDIVATLTDTNARRVLEAIKHSTDTGAIALAKQLTEHLSAQPKRCPHTNSFATCGKFVDEKTLALHLSEIHKYATNEECWNEGEKAEDTAETNAWNAFHI